MCGIAGILAEAPVNGSAVAAMMGLQAHRGPDDAGLWRSADGRAVLGHRRLSVIDTSPAGHQPMADGETVVVYNGEIYNFVELRRELEALGARFRGASDTEVLLKAYAAWGEDCVARFNGMFAFALLDGRRRRLFCARDRFGEKPFLFAARPGLFAFASEYKALLALAEVPREVAMLPLLRFLQNPRQGLDDGRETAFPAILQLLPGEALSLDLDTLAWTVRRYWTIDPDPALAGMAPEEAAARFRDLLIDAVRLRMRSDVALGSCLSGGLDSSAIVCLARAL